MRLARYGSFHVGGRRISITGQPSIALQLSPDTPVMTFDPNGDYLVDQAYVQSFEPEERRFETPVLLIHGGGLTGAIWEATAEGQPGWITRLVQAGATVHVIDNVERGRAGWCALPGVDRGPPIMRSDQEAWALYRFGRPEDYASRTPFPAQQFPVEHLDVMSRHHVPRWTTSDVPTEAALLQVLHRIGPSVVVGHSQGGGFAFRTAYKTPGLVPACLGIEPHAVPVPQPGDVVDRQSYAILLGDFIARSPFWIDLTVRISTVMACLADRGARTELLDLPALGLPGNSHMPMLDRNSDQVVAHIVAWLERLQSSGRIR